MIGAFIIPTGIGCQIGGHAGDATPAARLVASVCDTLLVHPNVVNSSDINEMPENSLYVEGSILDRMFQGELGLKPRTRANKILVAVNGPAENETINAVSASRVTLGADIEVVELDMPLIIKGWLDPESGAAEGSVQGWKDLCRQVMGMEFDALAIHSRINVDHDTMLRYYRNGGVNPWGRAEAIASKFIAQELDKPVAHGPIEDLANCSEELLEVYRTEVLNPRIASEAISNCYLHSVLKGLTKAPEIRYSGDRIEVKDIDFLVSPWGVWGEPHFCCESRGIPIIMVEENKPSIQWEFFNGKAKNVVHVANYLEAAGVVAAMRAKLDIRSVRYPIGATEVHRMAKEEVVA